LTIRSLKYVVSKLGQFCHCLIFEGLAWGQLLCSRTEQKPRQPRLALADIVKLSLQGVT